MPIDIYPPGGALASTLGYAEVTANQGSITTQVDLTGLSVTVTVPAGRRLAITGVVLFSNTAAGNQQVLTIQEDGANIRQAAIVSGAVSTAESCIAMVDRTPSAGTHTYKLQASAAVGTTTMVAGTSNPAFILVEDITGTVWPAGAAVTAGMVASEPWSPYTPVDLNVTVNNGTQVARYTKFGRTVDFFWDLVLGNTTSMGSGAAVAVGIPVPAAANGRWVVGAYLLDSGTQDYIAGAIIAASATTASLRLGVTTGTAINGGGSVTNTIPYTWGVNDRLTVSGRYEAAS